MVKIGVHLKPFIWSASDMTRVRSIRMEGSSIRNDFVSILMQLNREPIGILSAISVTSPTCPVFRRIDSLLRMTGPFSLSFWWDVRKERLTITPRDGCGILSDRISSTGFLDIGSSFCFHEKCSCRSIFIDSIGVRSGPRNTQNFCLIG